MHTDLERIVKGVDTNQVQRFRWMNTDVAIIKPS
jgi:hypothetical protein